MFQATETMNGLARLRHVTRIGGIARQFQREIGFASRVQLRRSARINGPAAIGELPATNIVCQLGNALRFGLSENVQIIDVIGFEGGVRFKLTLPEPFLGLKGK